MGQGSMPAANQAAQPDPRTMTSPASAPGGQGPRPSQPMSAALPKTKPNMNGNFKESEDLTAMLRIAGLR
jgi:hypothetical protein